VVLCHHERNAKCILPSAEKIGITDIPKLSHFNDLQELMIVLHFAFGFPSTNAPVLQK